jgi:membrane protein implicated in regulation of membrane protease activity
MYAFLTSGRLGLSSGRAAGVIMIAMLHGDAPFGWQGFAFAALAVVALVVFFNELARDALTNRPKKRKRNKSASRGMRT